MMDDDYLINWIHAAPGIALFYVLMRVSYLLLHSRVN